MVLRAINAGGKIREKRETNCAAVCGKPFTYFVDLQRVIVRAPRRMLLSLRTKRDESDFRRIR